MEKITWYKPKNGQHQMS